MIELELQTALEVRVERRQALKAEMAQLEKELDVENDLIKAWMIDMGEESLDVGDHVITLSVRDRVSLVKAELVSLGVSTETIKKAEKTVSFLQLDVRKK